MAELLTRGREAMMRQSRLLSISTLVFATPLLFGCASGGVTTGEELKQEMDLSPYSGPKATIAVGPCEDKSGGGANFAVEIDGEMRQFGITSEVGRGMADMFVTGLLNTDRFRVLETGAIEALEQEQAYAGEESQGRMAAADLIVTCAVTSLEPDAGGAGGIFGKLGGALGLGGLKKSSVALDIRLVDVETREILTAFTAEGTATDAALGGAVFGGRSVGGLGAFSNTPIEGAVKKAILSAAEHLAMNTPEEYFGEGT